MVNTQQLKTMPLPLGGSVYCGLNQAVYGRIKSTSGTYVRFHFRQHQKGNLRAQPILGSDQVIHIGKAPALNMSIWYKAPLALEIFCVSSLARRCLFPHTANNQSVGFFSMPAVQAMINRNW